MNIDEFKLRMKQKMAENRQAFEGTYKDQVHDLMGLSKSEIDLITPDSTDMEVYDQLITVVKEASRLNLSQAQLKLRIEELGTVALRIAGKVPSLTALI